uniref:Translation initiation factor 5A C-terminal domain-containing protein n=1 Tax=Seriola lalandi dorsalis TaxID=1841481 RepID=A0A3B4YQD2_SERLL
MCSDGIKRNNENELSSSHVIGICDGFLVLTDGKGETKEELRLPDGDLGKDIEKKLASGGEFLVTVIKAIDEEHITLIKSASFQ